MSSASPDTADYAVVPFREIQEASLAPQQIITGVPYIRDFRIVEEQVCLTVLSRYCRRPDNVFALENDICEDRITNYLRPEEFNGTLLQGYAILQPLNAERLATQDEKVRREVNRGMLTDAWPGITIVYGGEFHSSRTSPGTFLLESTIFLKRLLNPNRSHSNGNYLRRVLGPLTSIEQASQVTLDSKAASIESANKLARFALSRLYGGGSPE